MVSRAAVTSNGRPPRAVIVAGMHRSGTSAVTRVLSLLGLDLASNLYPAQEDNPLGFWEPADIVAAHDDFLASIGSSYDDVLPLGTDVLSSDVASAFVDGIVEFLDREFARSHGFVVKDPRLARLVPLWVEALGRFGASPAFVLPIRNPLDVAASLRARNDFGTTKSLLLWLRHVLEAEHATRGLTRSLVSYDELLVDWRAVVGRMGRDLDVVWPRTLGRAAAEIEAYLSLRHRHQHAGDEALEARADVAEWVKETYRALAAAARDGCGLDVDALDAVRASVDDADRLYGGVVARLGADLEVAEAVRTAQADELARLSRLLAETASEASRQQRSLGRLEAELAGAAADASARQSEVEAARDEAAQLREIVAEQREAIAASAREVARLRTSLTRREATLAERLAAAASSQRRLAGELEETAARLARVEDELARRPTPEELATATRAAAEANHRVERQAVEISRLVAEAAARQAAPAAPVPTVPASVSWTRRRSARQLASWLVHPTPSRMRFVRRYLALRKSDEFDALGYLAANPDVAAAGLNPLMHYVEHGAHEGRPAPRSAPPREPTRAQGARDAFARTVAALEDAGLFDARYYLETYPDVATSDLTPVQHFCAVGWREGRNPNAYFDTAWYLATYRDARAAAIDPLTHFLRLGDERKPSPRFDPEWYARAYGVHGGAAALSDYLAHAAQGVWRAPVEGFDPVHYLERNDDVRAAGVDPFLHYLHVGYAEGRPPSEGADAPRLASDLRSAGEVAGADDAEPDVAETVRIFTAPGPDYEAFDPTLARRPPDAKAIAFYLPQFHAIAENDAWWGTGFTDWRNVVRATPRFAGHHQPRIPRDLGFYDLEAPEVMRRQIELARAAGLHGFCFYYYSFGGRRLLERPLERFLSDRELDLPFCVMWANENWTRRWDGLADDVLIAQRYDERADAELVDDLQRHFDDPRYIRLDGRPLLLLYRADVIPDAAAAIARWRRLWQRRHGEDPVLLVAHAFGNDDPRTVGADGAFQFPPHRLAERLPPVNDRLHVLDRAFSGHVVAYDDLVEASRADVGHPYPLVRTVVPGWDNDARRQGAGLVVHGSTPRRYEDWLREVVVAARDEPVFGEPLVLVNAWNEWAEAAYLEPDVHFGAAYLNATARALAGPTRRGEPTKVLLVGHDAHPHGAQMILLHVADRLRRQFGCELDLHLLEGGALLARYEELGRVHVGPIDAAHDVYRGLRRDGCAIAVTNTVVVGDAVSLLKDEGFRVVSLVHELPGLIADYGLADELRRVAERADLVVVPATAVAESVADATGVDASRLIVRPQGLYRDLATEPAARADVRDAIGVDADATLVLGVGYADRRKGFDLFAATARLARSNGSGLRFAWVGDVHPDLADELSDGALVHVPFTDDVASYLAAADVYFLSSREDPFPSVVLEALASGLPVVGFRGAGGSHELVEEHGRLVEAGDTRAALAALVECGYDRGDASCEARRRLVAERFAFDDYAFDLLRAASPGLPKITVVVPNYDYARFLRGRLETIFQQTQPVFEVVVLDDCSTDDSLSELARIADGSDRRFAVVAAEANSGSVFRQWAQACRVARGELLWIAEADDLSDPRFLERAVAALVDADAAFAFTDSVPVDADGRPAAPSYKPYYRVGVGSLMDSSFVLDGDEFVRRCLAERNLVLNVSAVVWRRDVLLQALDECLDELGDYRLAGDWHVYATAALRSERVAYVAEPLNLHRRHDASVTGSLDKDRHLEDVRRIHEYVAERIDADEETRGRMQAYVAELEAAFAVGTPPGSRTPVGAGEARS